MSPHSAKMSSHRSQQNGTSSTMVLELSDLSDTQNRISPIHSNEKDRPRPSSLRELGRTLSKEDNDENEGETLPSPTTAVEKVQRWNEPRVNMVRSFGAFFSFIILGANDAALGALIPYLQDYYNLSYTVVSLAFLSPLAGYISAALLNNTIHLRFGQRGIAIIGPCSHILAYTVTAVHPPFPVIAVVFALAGFGSGVEDAAWNAWMGAMANANEILGFLHGFYGLGATIAPIVATTLVTQAGVEWYYFYYFMIGMATIELAVCSTSFWSASGAEFRRLNPRTTESKDNRMTEALFRRPAARVTWLCTLFLFGYMGIEVALGGWITEFMLSVRKGGRFASGMTATGFWLGMTVGRVVLGFVTPRIGENLAIIIYIPITIALELLFWLVPQFYVSAVSVAFQGFFLGPLFPAAVVAVSKLLPRHLHVSALGFASAVGFSGAALFPFAVGAIAQTRGVEVLQPVILALLVVVLGVWFGLPGMAGKGHEGGGERVRREGWRGVVDRVKGWARGRFVRR
ncbi:MFS general substrate transporter [Aulographum hederae CBS 113979]|uniref:MFS general substrate transporter n=1 Tax=Aulographum hederae CBS 113979 TaxID=1176131 RepID=A0A6G1H8D9_9PEZI|nr:MFS general substrate transporter [Aulographum hederae CBS 113979]